MGTFWAKNIIYRAILKFIHVSFSKLDFGRIFGRIFVRFLSLLNRHPGPKNLDSANYDMQGPPAKLQQMAKNATCFEPVKP